MDSFHELLSGVRVHIESAAPSAYGRNIGHNRIYEGIKQETEELSACKTID